jgi:hypothetical protein
VGLRTGLNTTAKKTIPSPCRESNPDRPARSLVAIPTEISGLYFSQQFYFCYRRRRRHRIDSFLLLIRL